MSPIISQNVDIVFHGNCEFEFFDNRTRLHFLASFQTETSKQDPLSDPEVHAQLSQIGLTTEQPLPDLLQAQAGLRASVRDATLVDYLSSSAASAAYYVDYLALFEQVETTDDLPKLPILEKSVLKRRLDDLISSEAGLGAGLRDGRYRFVRTSGTTGERVQVLTDLGLDRLFYDFEKVWGIDLDTDQPRTAVFTSAQCGTTECNVDKRPLEDRLVDGHTLYLESTFQLFTAPDSFFTEVVAEIATFKPHILFGNPTYLQVLGQKARALGLELPSIKLILTSFQYATSDQKRSLADLFSAKCFDVYSATELAGCGIGIECVCGHWHVREDQAIVEFVEERSIVPGVASIVVTTHANRLMPLVRYEVGDLAKLRADSCSCCLAGWQSFDFHGRAKDVVHLGGRAFTTRQIDEALSGHSDIAFYQLSQDQHGALCLKVVPDAGATPDLGRLCSALKELAPDCDIPVEVTTQIMPAASFKFPPILIASEST